MTTDEVFKLVAIPHLVGMTATRRGRDREATDRTQVAIPHLVGMTATLEAHDVNTILILQVAIPHLVGMTATVPSQTRYEKATTMSQSLT